MSHPIGGLKIDEATSLVAPIKSLHVVFDLQVEEQVEDTPSQSSQF